MTQRTDFFVKPLLNAGSTLLAIKLWDDIAALRTYFVECVVEEFEYFQSITANTKLGRIYDA